MSIGPARSIAMMSAPSCASRIACERPWPRAAPVTNATLPSTRPVPAPDGPLVETVEDKFEVIAAGEAVAITAGPGGGSVRPDLTAVPLRGVEPSHVVLATRANDRSRLVAAFRKTAQAQLTGAC